MVGDPNTNGRHAEVTRPEELSAEHDAVLPSHTVETEENPDQRSEVDLDIAWHRADTTSHVHSQISSTNGDGEKENMLTAEEQEEIDRLEQMIRSFPEMDSNSRRIFTDAERHGVARLLHLLHKKGQQLSVQDFCVGRNLQEQNVYNWRRKYDGTQPAREGGNAPIRQEPKRNETTQITPLYKPSAPEKLSVEPQTESWLRSNLPQQQKTADELAKEKERAQLILRQIGLIIRGDNEMERAWHEAMRAAGDHSQVLLRGETGTGKELFARAIHQLHATSGSTFYALNCAGLNEGVIESELFGHERGAFTDARQDRDGAFGKVAKGGTLLLDEIGDMPMSQQGKLLRVLENKEFSRVGSSTTLYLENTKIVAATNRPLETLVKQGKFRADLLHRLTENQVQIPPLRERSDAHFQHLVGHFISRMRQEDSSVYMTPEALALLRSLNHTGNVRDLRNHLQRACNEVRKEVRGNVLIDTEHVRSTVQTAQENVVNPTAELTSYQQGALEMGVSDDQNRVQAVIDLQKLNGNATEVLAAVRALVAQLMVQRSGHNQSTAANKLGITRGSLRNTLRGAPDMLIKDVKPD